MVKILNKEEALAAATAAGLETNVTVIDCKCLKHLFTTIRDKGTSAPDFARAANRLMTVLSEEAIACLPSTPSTAVTPCGEYAGCSPPAASDVCAVSIVRAGDSLLECLRGVWPEVSVGKILIQRDEETAEPKLFYCKLPKTVTAKHVMLVDPMLATGGSAACAVKCLIDAGVPEEKIMFVNVVACMQGLSLLLGQYPKIQVVTAEIDEGLNESAYIVPGLGDYGDRYFGTE